MVDTTKIIIVDDEPYMLEYIAAKVKDSCEQYSVFTATDGKKALQLIRVHKPDILLTDVLMPIMSGLDLIRIVKDEFPEIITIILSGHGEFSYAQQAVSLGVSQYLLKPVNARELADVLLSCKQTLAYRQRSTQDAALARAVMGYGERNDPPSAVMNVNLFMMLVCIGNLSQGLNNQEYLAAARLWWERIQTGGTDTSDIVNRIEGFLREHFTREISIEDIAAAFHFSAACVYPAY